MNALKRVILKWKYRFRRMKDRRYLIDGIPITLPSGHPLDWYQCLHPRYDRFLPALAEELPKDSIVLDIGANIGDSAIPFLRRGIHTWCVEPAAEFLAYLKKNIESNGFTDLATIIESIITSENGGVNLKVERGTAFINEKNNSLHEPRNMRLDDLMQRMERVDLIKSDTDGFDHDVLISGRQQIVRMNPMIYFENTVTPANKNGYEELYVELENAGYSHVHIFDNAGHVLKSNADWNTVRTFNTKIMSREWPEIPYLDILTGSEKHRTLMDRAINRYNNLFA